jgi:hypothetical protein
MVMVFWIFNGKETLLLLAKVGATKTRIEKIEWCFLFHTYFNGIVPL